MRFNLMQRAKKRHLCAKSGNGCILDETDTCVKDPRGTPGTQPNWAKAADPKLVVTMDALQGRICDGYNNKDTKYRNSGDPADSNLYSGKQVCILDERCAWMRFSRPGEVDEEEKCGPAPTRAPMTIGKQANVLAEPDGVDVAMRSRDDQAIEERQLMMGMTAPLMGENGQPMIPTATVPLGPGPNSVQAKETSDIMYVEMNNWNSYWRRSIHRGSEPDPKPNRKDFANRDVGIISHGAGRGYYAPNDGRLMQQETYLSQLRAAEPSDAPPVHTLQGLGNVFARSQRSVRSYGGYSCNDRRQLREGVKNAYSNFTKAAKKWKHARKSAKKGDDSWKQLKSVAESLREEWEHLKDIAEECKPNKD